MNLRDHFTPAEEAMISEQREKCREIEREIIALPGWRIFKREKLQDDRDFECQILRTLVEGVEENVRDRLLAGVKHLPDAYNLARMFHEEYERLAPELGYRTREESSVPWDRVPATNKNLMIATARAVLKRIQ